MRFFLSIICLLAVSSVMLAASPDSAQGRASSYGSQDNMSTAQAREYDRYLFRVLNALHGLDPVMQAELPQWSVNDRELKRRIISHMQQIPEYRARIDQTADVVVTQNPRTAELLRISIGSVVLNSRQEIEYALGVTTYDRLKEANYDKLMRSNPAEERKNYSISFSFYRGAIALEKSGFAFEWINGKEEIGYPFWLNGTMTLGGAFVRENVIARMGIDLVPSNYGVSDAKILGPFSFHHRKLEGAGGASGSLTIRNFGLDPADGTIGGTGLFTYSFGLGSRTDLTLNPVDGYSTGLIGLVYLTYAFPTTGTMAGLSFSAGGGAHRIDHVTTIPNKEELKLLGRGTYGDPFAKVAYDHLGEDRYGFSVQYSNLLLTSGYYEIISGFGLEMKYALRLNNRNSPWEYESFFSLSPRFSISM